MDTTTAILASQAGNWTTDGIRSPRAVFMLAHDLLDIPTRQIC
jgi:hypothetical protein